MAMEVLLAPAHVPIAAAATSPNRSSATPSPVHPRMCHPILPPPPPQPAHVPMHPHMYTRLCSSRCSSQLGCAFRALAADSYHSKTFYAASRRVVLPFSTAYWIFDLYYYCYFKQDVLIAIHHIIILLCNYPVSDNPPHFTHFYWACLQARLHTPARPSSSTHPALPYTTSLKY